MEFVNWELAEAREQQYLVALEAVADAARAVREGRPGPSKAWQALAAALEALNLARGALLTTAQDAKPSEEHLTREAFLAVVIHGIRKRRGTWYWLCLSDETRQEMLLDAQVSFSKWRAAELIAKQERVPGPVSMGRRA